MKNRHILSPANAASKTRARVHAFMAIAGIIIAVVCAVILLQETPAAHDVETSRVTIGEVSKLTHIVRIASSWEF